MSIPVHSGEQISLAISGNREFPKGESFHLSPLLLYNRKCLFMLQPTMVTKHQSTKENDSAGPRERARKQERIKHPSFCASFIRTLGTVLEHLRVQTLKARKPDARARDNANDDDYTNVTGVRVCVYFICISRNQVISRTMLVRAHWIGVEIVWRVPMNLVIRRRRR